MAVCLASHTPHPLTGYGDLSYGESVQEWYDRAVSQEEPHQSVC